jgi:hypothetical protein
LSYTVTDQTVVRNERWHEVEIIAPGTVPSNWKGGVVIRDYYYNGTLNYHNVKSLTLDAGQVSNTFTVQSTLAGTPVRINGDGTYLVGLNGSIKSIHSQLTFYGGSASDTVLVDDSLATSTTPDTLTIANGTANDVQLGMAAADQFFGSGGGLDCFGMGLLTVNLSKTAGAKATVSPSTIMALALNANGPNADLELNTGGLSFQETQTSPGTGKFTFGSSAKAVSFQNFGTVHTH